MNGERVVDKTDSDRDAWGELKDVKFNFMKQAEDKRADDDPGKKLEHQMDAYFEAQPEEKQKQIRKEWGKLELLRIGVEQEHQDLERKQKIKYALSQEVRAVTKKHLDDEDAIPYLANVLNMTPVEVVYEMCAVDLGKTIDNYDRVVKMFEDYGNAGLSTISIKEMERSLKAPATPKQMALAVLTDHREPQVMSGPDSWEVQPASKESEEKLIRIAQENGLVNSESLLGDYAYSCMKDGDQEAFERHQDYLLENVGRRRLAEIMINLTGARVMGRPEDLGEGFRDLPKLAEIRSNFIRPDLKAEQLVATEVSDEVKEEQELINERVAERRDQARLYKVMEKFEGRSWKKLDEKARVKVVHELMDTLVDDFGIMAPCEVGFVSSQEIDANMGSETEGKKSTTRGKCSEQWVHESDPRAKEYLEQLGKANIQPKWIPGARVIINRDYLDDGASIAGTVAHELRHAYQHQQAFLYGIGYYIKMSMKQELEERTVVPGEMRDDLEEEETEIKKLDTELDEFDWAPHAAEYYAANLGMAYINPEVSYEDYRAQLVEAEAFKEGALYGNGIRHFERRKLFERIKDGFTIGRRKKDKK